MIGRLLGLIALSGCAAGDATCEAGFEGGEDGLCYQLDDTDNPTPGTTLPTPTTGSGATMEDIFDALPPCESPTTGDGTLDLDGGCIDGACAGMTYDEIVAVLGDGDCAPFFYETDAFTYSAVDCAWPGGIAGSFDDADADEVADDDATTYSLSVDLPSDATTPDGLGLDVEIRCFIDAYGYPSYAAFEDTLVDGWMPTYMSFSAFSVEDYHKDGSDWEQDGYVEALTLYQAF